MNHSTNCLTKSYLNELVFNRGVFQIQPNATFDMFKAAMETIVIICNTHLDPVIYLNVEFVDAWIKSQEKQEFFVFNIDSELLNENAFNECRNHQ